MSQYENILALDTATYVQAIAVIEGDHVRERLESRVRYNHGESLLPNVDSVLAKHDIDIGDFDLISVGLGPGAFTGLRVSLALAKSFSRSAEVPLVGVSTLAALAYEAATFRPGELIAPMYDARRSEVFMGMYKAHGEKLGQVIDDRTASPEEAREVLDKHDADRITVIGNGPEIYPEILEGELNVDVSPGWLNAPSGVAIGLLGKKKANNQGPDSVFDLEPNYIRPSDAEL